MKIPKARKLPSGNWFIQLRMDGQSISVTERTEALCVAKAMAMKTGLIKIKRKPDEMTLGAAIDKYIAVRDGIISPTTIRSYKSMRNFRFQSIMEERLGSLTVKKIQAAIKLDLLPNKNGKRLKPKTIENAIGLLKPVLSDHVDLDLSKLVLPQKEEYIAEVLTPDEVGKLLLAIQGEAMEVPILLAVWYGLRRSEIAGLEKSDFDIKNSTVTIRSARVFNENNELIKKNTKTTKSTRVLSCPKYILEKVALLPDGLILQKHPNAVYKALQKICEKNGLTKVRLHDLRHVAASIMSVLNVPDKYAMARGGWSNKKIMQGKYQQAYDTEQQRINATIDSYYSTLMAAAGSEKR